ncbi:MULTISPECIES: ATP-binding protein [unclassified Saccharicrinis]|uniref:ATP-binding protein n=1 Tax=unclassified Saccharicrinis TaxID=2646859 RepID=UPI003D33325E
MVTIVDDGEGMDAVFQNLIFEPFLTTKEAGDGAGLGISTVDNIINKHGVEIRVGSDKGGGSNFTAIIPVKSKK